MIKDRRLIWDVIRKRSATTAPTPTTETTTNNVTTGDCSLTSIIGTDTSLSSSSSSMSNNDYCNNDSNNGILATNCNNVNIQIDQQQEQQQILSIDRNNYNNSISSASVVGTCTDDNTSSFNTIIDSLLLPICYDISYSFTSMGMILSNNQSYDRYDYDSVNTSESSPISMHVLENNNNNNTINFQSKTTTTNLNQYEMYEPSFYDITSWIQLTLNDSYCYSSCSNDDNNDGNSSDKEICNDVVIHYKTQQIQHRSQTKTTTTTTTTTTTPPTTYTKPKDVSCKVQQQQQKSISMNKTISITTAGSCTNSKPVSIDITNELTSTIPKQYPHQQKMNGLKEEEEKQIQLTPCECLYCNFVSSLSSSSLLSDDDLLLSENLNNKNHHHQRGKSTKKKRKGKTNSKINKNKNVCNSQSTTGSDHQPHGYDYNKDNCTDDSLSASSGTTTLPIQTSLNSLTIVLLSLIVSNSTLLTPSKQSSTTTTTTPLSEASVDTDANTGADPDAETSKVIAHNNNNNNNNDCINVSNTTNCNVCVQHDEGITCYNTRNNSNMTTHTSHRRPSLVSSVNTSNSNCSFGSNCCCDRYDNTNGSSKDAITTQCDNTKKNNFGYTQNDLTDKCTSLLLESSLSLFYSYEFNHSIIRMDENDHSHDYNYISHMKGFDKLNHVCMYCYYNRKVIISYCFFIWLFIVICVESFVLQLLFL